MSGPRRSRGAPVAIGIDTGGTFTDFVVLARGAIETFKLPSTPSGPERAVLEGLARARATRATRASHGSTVATNALLERKGAKVTFVTTAGFEDLLEIGRQDRPDLYALEPRRQAPLVPRARRIGVAQRSGPLAQRWRALTASGLARMRRAVARTRPEAIAIGFLHAYAAPADERAAARALEGLGVPVSVSSEVCAEVREFERFATTVANAYLLPRVSRYLGTLAERSPARLEIVLSHGGTAEAARAAREPVRQLLSGPAAGVRAARDLALACGYDAALTIDVGGTSTDCAYVAHRLPRRRGRTIAGLPIQLPMLDVHTIGAGGGSRAWVDAGGMLHVGPESAGADPGPACYGRGGPATVTDALVTLGRIPGDSLAAGTFPIRREEARRALERLARELGTRDPVRAAVGVVALAEAHMAAALRVVSIERGYDPRGKALVCFGGAGGLHACALAAALDLTVVFPRHAGVLSAVGALISGSRRERSRSVLIEARDKGRIAAALAALTREALHEFPARDRARVRVERWGEVRYRGQSHELSVEMGPAAVARFHIEHERRFGFHDPDAEVEVVTLEVRATLPPATGLAEALRERPGRRASSLGTARVHHAGRWHEAAVWDGDSLPVGFRTRGPAIVVEAGATLWIAPGFRARRHERSALILTR